MKPAKRIFALLLAAVLLLGLCACGKDESAYTVIETVGEKRYCTAFRLDDKLSVPVTAAMSVLAANGELSALSSQWLGEDIICLEGSSDAVSLLAEPVEPRTLIVGVENEYAPLAYSDGGEYIGMSVDIANAIGSLLGWEIKIQPISASDVGTQLSSGNIDCALGFSIDNIDSAAYTVGECYMTSEIVVVVPSGSDAHSIKDLKDLKIGTVKDQSIISALEGNDKVVKYVDSVTVYLSPARCINALGHSWCAAVAMDRIMLVAYFANSSEEQKSPEA